VKKIGPLSIDIIVACQIYENQDEVGSGVGFRRLVEGLEGVAAKSTILNALNTLAQWGVITVEFGETETGRAGRLYSVSGESKELVRSTYDKFWPRVMEEIERIRREHAES